MLTRPDDRTLEALKRLQRDADFQEILTWLEYSMHELDRANRNQPDGVILRMQQGGAQALAELVDRVRGKQSAGAIERSNTVMAGSARNT